MFKNPFKKLAMLKKKIPDPDPGATDPFSTLANLGRAVRGHRRITTVSYTHLTLPTNREV